VISCIHLKYFLKYILLFSCFGLFAQTITAPQIACVSVLPTGSVSVTWQIPSDPNHEFQSYQLYASAQLQSGYTQLDSVTNYTTNNCILPINGNSKPFFIYIQTITKSHVTIPAIDTVRTIFLSLSGTNGTPQLFWNGFANPLPAGEGSGFDVYRGYPVGVWTKIAYVPLNANGNINYSYTDTISICADSIHYRVEFADGTYCTSVSNVNVGYFKDIIRPNPPLLDSVSVNANGLAIMGISPSSSNDVKAFIAYLYINSTGQSIDTAFTANTPIVYTYTASHASSGSEVFELAAIDYCSLKAGSIDINNRQGTIYTSVTYDPCKKTNNLTWNPYLNMITGVDHYEIYCSVNLGPFAHLADTTATVYPHKGLSSATYYRYYVRAHSKGKTVAGKDTASSTSNTYSITTSNPPEPKFAYLDNVTVNPEQSIDIAWYVDSMGPIGAFDLYRAVSSKTSVYSIIKKNIPFTRNTSHYSFTDENANTNNTMYFYFVEVLDSACLNPVMQTNTSNSIVLKAIPTPNLTATLNWNNYAVYTGGVSGYNVYRSVNGVFGKAASNVQGTTYVDDLSPFVADEGIFIYYVEAVEGTGDTYGFTERSWSNYDTVYVDANMYIPNAFIPYGANKVFLPIGAFVENDGYLLRIYNRLGEKIYETTDSNAGWDGGSYQQGVYAYTLQYKTSVGEYRQRNGTVTLIR
jgi:hypothetical protein